MADLVRPARRVRLPDHCAHDASASVSVGSLLVAGEAFGE
ncbi:hypothetical protein SCATT_p08040 (plasmid) [Streptantibioticus cattleyicolor NRRL 8057 = DSM 46488]|uniref:Uncharacterized protein n=1 Tax=Streptantibioticus cattleyicolor (strain ATCC 35852 / DSM 46488 / JCM 4925 / NBRC 14057 / NRRL 8057) TaxID=1003195 RepID=G8XD51_STREN|nr:hypothetical protein SCATT_p08040 [Streptantibioticus cattleyicolor NRRL 8057 = DSM 46488]